LSHTPSSGLYFYFSLTCKCIHSWTTVWYFDTCPQYAMTKSG
jgi:hypothetical protein